MILAQTLSPNTPGSRRLDADAVAFANASGATDVKALSDFVKGVKDLGLWSSMVCWPLRSSQNAGTGTTAYSLGGLGTFNGTLVNGPTWGADGIVFSATNRQINLPDSEALYTALSGFFVFNSSSTAANQQIYDFQDWSQGGGSGWYRMYRIDGDNTFGSRGGRFMAARGGLGSTNSAARTAGLNSFQSGGYTADDSTDNVFRNGSLEFSGARTGLSAFSATGPRLNRFIFGNSDGMTGAFALASSSKFTNQQVSDIHNLYRDTLGAGLGLP